MLTVSRTSTRAPRKSVCATAPSVGFGCTQTRKTSAIAFSRRPLAALPSRSGRNCRTRRSSSWRSATRIGWSTPSSTRSFRSGPPVTALTELPALFALFEEVWCVDFEFIARSGERYDVVCLVAHELKSGRILRLWRTQLGPNPPYRTDAGVLFVCFVGNAELGCHLSLGWPLPARVIDLSPEFRCITNGRKTPAG